MRAENVRTVSACPTLARIRFRVRPSRRRGIIHYRGASMNKLLPIAVVYGIFSSNSNAATQAKLDLLCQATLYPDETRAMLKRQADAARARNIAFVLFWVGVWLFIKFVLLPNPTLTH